MSLIRKLAPIALLACALPAMAVPVITEDFEGDLSAWTGKQGGAHDGVIVVDPFDSTNHVLTFTSLEGAGEIFTVQKATSLSGVFTVSFDYLGLPKPGSVPGDLGGYFGISQGLPSTHQWVAGTGSFPTPIDLVDDGTWHHYELTFNSTIGTDVHFMLEDWIGSGGVPGDIYFDNLAFGDPIAVENLPVPGAWMLLLVGLAGLGYRRSQR